MIQFTEMNFLDLTLFIKSLNIKPLEVYELNWLNIQKHSHSHDAIGYHQDNSHDETFQTKRKSRHQRRKSYDSMAEVENEKIDFDNLETYPLYYRCGKQPLVYN